MLYSGIFPRLFNGTPSDTVLEKMTLFPVRKENHPR